MPNSDGLAYAERQADAIIAYRDVPVDRIFADGASPPWEWRTAKSFQKITDPGWIPEDPCGPGGIYECDYKGKSYYYGINKDETTVTNDMRKNGTWFVYTWAD